VEALCRFQYNWMLGIEECGSTNRMFSGPLILPGGQPRGSLTPGIRNRPMSLLLNVPTKNVLQIVLYIRMIEMLSFGSKHCSVFFFHTVGRLLFLSKNSKIYAGSKMPSTTSFKSSEGSKPSMFPSKKIHIADQPMTLSNWHQHISWINVIFVAGIPLFGIIMAYSTPLLLKTALWALFYYFLTGLGITAGTFLAVIPFSFPRNLTREKAITDSGPTPPTLPSFPSN
jgi:hypothetical protein